MSVMDEITTGKVESPQRILLYGTHGIGKSTFGSMAVNPVFIQIEDGLDHIDCAKFPQSTSFGDVMEKIGGLYSEEHGIKTVVVDSLDWLERLIWAEVAKDENKTNIEKIGYAKGYQFALAYWSQFLDGLSALRSERGITVILICHQRIERFENPDTEAYDRYVPRIHKLASGLVQEWCDDVLFATYKVYTTVKEGAYGKENIKPAGGEERFLKTVESPTCLAKNRLEMPNEIPFTWADYSKYLKKGE